jgi:hypothetical protein
MKKRVTKDVISKIKKSKPSEEFMQLILDKSKAILRKDDLFEFENKLDKKLKRQSAEQSKIFEGMIKSQFDTFTSHFVTVLDSVIKDNAKTFSSEVDQVKSRVNILETKVKILEGKE